MTIFCAMHVTAYTLHVTGWLKDELVACELDALLWHMLLEHPQHTTYNRCWFDLQWGLITWCAHAGSGLGTKSKGQMGPSGRQQRADKAPSALEAALQCQEDLADDAAAAAASPGNFFVQLAACKQALALQC